MSDSGLEELYQELLREHHKSPKYFGSIAEPTSSCLVHNPLCGDKVEVFLKAEIEASKSGRIAQVSFVGKGCSISQASASMMTALVLGKTTGETLQYVDLFRKMMKQDLTASELEQLGDAAALQGVKRFAARIKCAQLAWEALDQAIKKIVT